MKRYKIEIIPAAYRDMKEARNWYRIKSSGLPKRFIQQVRITLETISLLPVRHAIRYRNVLLAQLAVFPYAVHFIMKKDKIVVPAVYHTAINPNKWMSRL